MHYKDATMSTHTLMKKAFEDIESLIQGAPTLKIEHPETLIAAYVQSATQIYLHERIQKEGSISA